MSQNLIRLWLMTYIWHTSRNRLYFFWRSAMTTSNLFFGTKRLAAHLRSAEIVQLNLELPRKYSEIRKSWSFEPVATGDFDAEKVTKKDTGRLGSQCQYKGDEQKVLKLWCSQVSRCAMLSHVVIPCCRPLLSHVVIPFMLLSHVISRCYPMLSRAVIPCYLVLLFHVISCSFFHFVVQAKHVGYLNAERKGKAGARETFWRLSVCAWRWLCLRSCQSFLCCRKTVWTSQHQSCRQRFSTHSYVHAELSVYIILLPNCQTW